MTIGGANLTAFVGKDAPYWTDLDSDGTVNWVQPDGTPVPAGTTVTVDGKTYGDVDNDSIVDADETAELNENSIGMSITDVDLGLAIMDSYDPLALGRFIAGRLSADSIALVGVDSVQADLSHVVVELNVGASLADLVAAVDFPLSFPAEDRDGDGIVDPAGYAVYTGNADYPVLLDFDSVSLMAQAAGKLIVLDGAENEVFRLSGALSLDLNLSDSPSVALFVKADLEFGPPEVDLFDMSMTGVLFIDQNGIAADAEVVISAGDPSVISFDAAFRAVLNYYGEEQEFKVPSQFIGGGYLTQ